jgi:DNA polymerase-3 subunit epsilon
MSHFSSDHQVETEFKLSQGVTNIEIKQTGGELEALLLESQLIKDMQPLYNRKLRRNQKLTLVRQNIDRSGYISLSMEDTAVIDPAETEDILAVFPTKGRARQALNQIIKDYSLCPKLFGFEKGSGSCFAHQLRRCHGACVAKETAQAYNSRLAMAFERQRIEDWPFSSPVVVQEKQPQPASKSLVVDRWCVIADITHEPDCSPAVKFHERVFDLDTYKILRSYIKGRAHQLHIKPVSFQYLRQLENAA